MNSAERRVVLWASLVAAVLVVVHSVLWDIARWDGHTFVADNADLVVIGHAKVTVFRVSLLADAFGSYLLTIPATVALWQWLRRGRDDSIVHVLAISGLIYAAAGAVAAVVWAEAGAELIRQWDDRGGSYFESARFATLSHAAIATWQMVCVVTGGVWWLGSGLLLRGRWTWFARYSIVFGAASIAVGLLRIAGVEFNVAGPATPAFLPIAVWIGWLGVLLSRTDR